MRKILTCFIAVVVTVFLVLVLSSEATAKNEMVPIDVEHPILIADPIDVDAPSALPLLIGGLVLMVIGWRRRSK